jgi:hypothetical protein
LIEEGGNDFSVFRWSFDSGFKDVDMTSIGGELVIEEGPKINFVDV